MVNIIQRMTKRPKPTQKVTRVSLYKKWARQDATANELSWMWKKFTELAGKDLTKFTDESAVRSS